MAFCFHSTWLIHSWIGPSYLNSFIDSIIYFFHKQIKNWLIFHEGLVKLDNKYKDLVLQWIGYKTLMSLQFLLHFTLVQCSSISSCLYSTLYDWLNNTLYIYIRFITMHINKQMYQTSSWEQSNYRDHFRIKSW